MYATVFLQFCKNYMNINLEPSRQDYISLYIYIFIMFYSSFKKRVFWPVLDSCDDCFWVWKTGVQISQSVETVPVLISLGKACGLVQESSDVSSVQVLMGKYSNFSCYKKKKKTGFSPFFPLFFFSPFISVVYIHLLREVYWLYRWLYWCNTNVSCLDIL